MASDGGDGCDGVPSRSARERPESHVFMGKCSMVSAVMGVTFTLSTENIVSKVGLGYSLIRISIPADFTSMTFCDDWDHINAK
jgi:hypothetical protein